MGTPSWMSAPGDDDMVASEALSRALTKVGRFGVETGYDVVGIVTDGGCWLRGELEQRSWMFKAVYCCPLRGAMGYSKQLYCLWALTFPIVTLLLGPHEAKLSGTLWRCGLLYFQGQ